MDIEMRGPQTIHDQRNVHGPKKQKGEFRMVASMASGWRRETKLGAVQERAWNKKVAGEDGVARPGSSCLCAMEDRQIPLDILKACGYSSLQGLWGFVKLYDSIDPQVLYEEMKLQEYGHAKMARASAQRPHHIEAQRTR